MTGTIKVLTDKGYGFISVEGQEKDIFLFHANLVDVTFDELNVGETVEFEVESTEKGPQAINIKRVEGEASADEELPMAA
jgi:CspA family cold shock protein